MFEIAKKADQRSQRKRKALANENNKKRTDFKNDTKTDL